MKFEYRPQARSYTFMEWLEGVTRAEDQLLYILRNMVHIYRDCKLICKGIKDPACIRQIVCKHIQNDYGL